MDITAIYLKRNYGVYLKFFLLYLTNMYYKTLFIQNTATYSVFRETLMGSWFDYHKKLNTIDEKRTWEWIQRIYLYLEEEDNDIKMVVNE